MFDDIHQISLISTNYMQIIAFTLLYNSSLFFIIKLLLVVLFIFIFFGFYCQALLQWCLFIYSIIEINICSFFNCLIDAPKVAPLRDTQICYSAYLSLSYRRTCFWKMYMKCYICVYRNKHILIYLRLTYCYVMALR